MANQKSSGKLILFVIVALIGGLAGFGYFNQAAKLDDTAQQTNAAVLSEEKKFAATPTIDSTILDIKMNDLVIGDANAPVTMVEYSSLSCPHCAQFHTNVLPQLQKNFIDTGKVKLVVRAFPLNEPAVKGAMIVDCAGQNGLNRENFIKVLFDMQAQWAFSEGFLKDLKQIALVGGIDSAAFDSCVNDKDLETRILTSRQDAETKLTVTSTPTFFINEKKYEGEPSVGGFDAALSAAASAAK